MRVCLVVLVFILFDIVTGFAKAMFDGTVNSTKLREGGKHKFAELVAVAGSYLAEYAVAYVNLGFDLPMLNVVSAYICVMEAVSIIENLCEMNPEMARLFSAYLEKMKRGD